MTPASKNSVSFLGVYGVGQAYFLPLHFASLFFSWLHVKNIKKQWINENYKAQNEWKILLCPYYLYKHAIFARHELFWFSTFILPIRVTHLNIRIFKLMLSLSVYGSETRYSRQRCNQWDNGKGWTVQIKDLLLKCHYSLFVELLSININLFLLFG